MQCSRCGLEQFCNQDCFKAGWKKHKKICVPKSHRKSGDSRDFGQSQQLDDLDLAYEACRCMEKENIGNLAGTNTVNIIGSYLFKGIESTATSQIHDQQQIYMKHNRIPVMKAAVEGNFSLYKVGGHTNPIPLSEVCSLLKDGAMCYIEYGRIGKRTKTVK